MSLLYDGERLDEVNESLHLIQRTDGLVFGTDALLLAAYVDRTVKRAAELGAGTGIVSLLLTRRAKAAHVDAVEIQAAYADLARRNVDLNDLQAHISVHEEDLRSFAEAHAHTYELVVANPPYMKADSGYLCRTDAKTVARHEICGTIEEWCASATRMLRYGGYLAVVYRPDRLTDLLCAMRAADLEPKRMTLVAADASSAPSMVLILAKHKAASGLHLTPPLILYADRAHTVPTDALTYIMNEGRFPDEYRAGGRVAKRKGMTDGTGKE